MRILIIDDDHDGSESLSRLFIEAGHQTTLADNGKRGLFLLATQEFDGVLLDLLMADTNGWEFLEVMRNESPREVPVIVLTGFSEISPWVMVPYEVPIVTKPCQFSDLLKLCEKQFAKSGQA